MAEASGHGFGLAEQKVVLDAGDTVGEHAARKQWQRDTGGHDGQRLHDQDARQQRTRQQPGFGDHAAGRSR